MTISVNPDNIGKHPFQKNRKVYKQLFISDLKKYPSFFHAIFWLPRCFLNIRIGYTKIFKKRWK